MPPFADGFLLGEHKAASACPSKSSDSASEELPPTILRINQLNYSSIQLGGRDRFVAVAPLPGSEDCGDEQSVRIARLERRNALDRIDAAQSNKRIAHPAAPE